MQEFSIRPIQEKDFEGFRDLFCKSECLCNIGRETEQEDLLSFGQAYVQDVILNGDMSSFTALCSVFRTPPGRGELWIMVGADQGEEKVIGAVGLEFKDAGTAELRRMCIAHEVRRRGLGLRLVEHCLSFAKQQGYLCVLLTTPVVNSGAISMYMKAGFTRREDLEYSRPEIGIKNLRIAQLARVL